MTRTLRMMGIILTVMTLFSTGNSPVNAQAPQAFNYQAVARNSTGDLIQNQLVTFRISILQDSPEGTLLYRESHAVTTNDFGLANLQIGKGSVLDGTFSGIDWSTGQKHLKVELDPAGGTAYVEMGTAELLSVPYALFADNTEVPPEISDADGDTKVQVEKNPDEDIIRFDLGGSEVMKLINKRIELINADSNIFIGANAGQFNTFSHSNSFIGFEAGKSNTIGNSNTFIGSMSGNFNSEGINNTFVGKEAGYKNISGSYNTFVGVASGKNSTGTCNTFLGDGSGLKNSTGSYNTFLGAAAGRNNISGYENLFSGYQAGISNSDGYYNTFLGTYSGSTNSGGFGNTFTGYYSGQANTTGFGNSFYGHYAGAMNTDGNFNSYFGENTGSSNSGFNNAFFGAEAGLSMSSGSNNILLGYKAGKNLTTGSNNIILGYDIDAPLPAGSNQMVIGAADLLYGDLANKRIGIGTSAPDPSSVLDITSTTRGILVPRMTTAQRQAIAAPVKGLLIFDITTNSFWFNNGSTWLEMGIGSSTDINWAKTGNNIYNTNTGSVGIGTSAPKGKMDINLYKGGTAGSLVTDYSHQLVLGGNYDTGPNQTGVKLWIGDYNNDGTDVYPVYCEDENNKVDFWIKNRANQTTAMPTMFFDGRFGIGTTSPSSSRLQLEGANSYDATLRLNNTGTNGTDFFMSSTSDTWGTGGAKFVMGHGLAQTSNVDFTLNSSGNVGIGTTAPQGMLHLNDDGDASLIVEADANDNGEGDNPRIEMRQDGNQVIGALGFIGSDESIYPGSTANALYLVNEFDSPIQFGTDSIINMTLSELGDLGIGTHQPLGRLSVQSMSGTSGNYSIDKGLVIKDGAYNSGNDFEIKGSSGVANLVVDDNGNLGIGTSIPQGMIHLNSNQDALLIVEADDNNSTGTENYNPRIELRQDEKQVTGGIGFIGSSGEIYPNSLANSLYIANDYGAPIQFATDSTIKMTLSESGHLGIGTNQPEAGLHIKGTEWPQSFLYLQSNQFHDAGIRFYEGTSAKWHIFNDASANGMTISNLNGNIALFAKDANGYVGIGTDNPTHLLSVNGEIRSKKVIVNTNWSDFVFEETYNLRPLYELDQFIKDNKHLPEIPSATEVEENGISLGDMDAKLLQKIEELTLYAIDQQKMIDMLVKQNDELMKRVKEIEKSK